MLSVSLSTLARFVITAACLMLAYVGFCQAYPVVTPRQPLQYLELAYTSVQLALGQFPQDLRGRPIPMSLQIARFALPISAAWATFSLILAQFGNYARAWNVRSRGDHLVVIGEGLLAQGLVKGESGRKRRVLAWAEEASGALARTSEAVRAAFVVGPRGVLDLKALGLEKARGFVGASDSDAVNIEAAKRVIDHALSARRLGDPLQVLVRVDNPDLQSALEQRLSGREQRGRVELRFVSAPGLLARQFLLENPIDRLAPSNNGRVRVCLIGWSPLAEALLIRILATAHFNNGLRPELIVADRDARRIEAAFLSRRPGAREIASIAFVELEDAAPRLLADWAADASKSEPFTAIFLTGYEPSAVLSTALALEARFAAAGLFIPPLYGNLPDADPDGAGLVEDSMLTPFGSLRTLANPEVLLQERHDEIARSIHDFYLEGRLNAGEALGDRPPLAEWPDLPESVRDENRLVADCYHFKLREIGASIVDGVGEGLRFTPNEVEALAEAEHRRWMAAKVLSGWVWAAERDDAAKRHPDLVPYAELSEAVKDLDREQVRMIPRILKLAHRKALRDLKVAFAKPENRAVQETEVKTALQSVSEDYPDRRITLLGDPDDAAMRPLLFIAARMGVPVSLIITRPVSAIPGAAPPSEQAATAAMIRGAHRIFDLSHQTHSSSRPSPDVELSLTPASSRRPQ